MSILSLAPLCALAFSLSDSMKTLQWYIRDIIVPFMWNLAGWIWARKALMELKTVQKNVFEIKLNIEIEHMYVSSMLKGCRLVIYLQNKSQFFYFFSPKSECFSTIFISSAGSIYLCYGTIVEIEMVDMCMFAVSNCLNKNFLSRLLCRLFLLPTVGRCEALTKAFICRKLSLQSSFSLLG